jgi:hypothetical protein
MREGVYICAVARKAAAGLPHSKNAFGAIGADYTAVVPLLHKGAPTRKAAATRQDGPGDGAALKMAAAMQPRWLPEGSRYNTATKTIQIRRKDY